MDVDEEVDIDVDEEEANEEKLKAEEHKQEEVMLQLVYGEPLLGGQFVPLASALLIFLLRRRRVKVKKN